MRVLHLSDTHLGRARGPRPDGIDPRASLRQMLLDCADVDGVDVIVVSGDVTDDGSVEAYAGVLTMVGDFALDRAVPTVYCVGNHDDRANFAEILGTGHRGHDGRDEGRMLVQGTDARAAVSELNGYRFITLDSVVPGRGYGEIDTGQLSALGDLLAVPSSEGSILVMHHPPISPARPVFEALMLQNAAALADVVDDSDVRVLLCGHFHCQINGGLGRTPVIVTPGVVNRIDLSVAATAERLVQGAGATVVDLGEPSGPLSYAIHSRDPLAGRIAGEKGWEELRRVLSRIGPER